MPELTIEVRVTRRLTYWPAYVALLLYCQVKYWAVGHAAVAIPPWLGAIMWHAYVPGRRMSRLRVWLAWRRLRRELLPYQGLTGRVRRWLDLRVLDGQYRALARIAASWDVSEETATWACEQLWPVIEREDEVRMGRRCSWN
jgi:hypothetical protein